MQSSDKVDMIISNLYREKAGLEVCEAQDFRTRE